MRAKFDVAIQSLRTPSRSRSASSESDDSAAQAGSGDAGGEVGGFSGLGDSDLGSVGLGIGEGEGMWTAGDDEVVAVGLAAGPLPAGQHPGWTDDSFG